MSQDMYRQQLIERFQNLQYRELLSVASVDISESNPLCGDSLRVQLKVAGGVVEQVGWEGDGCAISLVSVDMLAEHIIGKHVDDVLKFSDEDMVQLVGIDLKPSRVKCAVLGLQAARQGLSQVKR